MSEQQKFRRPSEKRQRQKVLQLRVSEAEWERVLRRAAACRQAPSVWLRGTILQPQSLPKSVVLGLANLSDQLVTALRSGHVAGAESLALDLQDRLQRLVRDDL